MNNVSFLTPVIRKVICGVLDYSYAKAIMLYGLPIRSAGLALVFCFGKRGPAYMLKGNFTHTINVQLKLFFLREHLRYHAARAAAANCFYRVYT